MRLRLQHIVETRFSMRVGFGPDAFSPEWLKYRLDLFRRFCLPSVAAQTTTSFTWLVFCDESTDGTTLAELRSHERDIDTFRLAITKVGRDHRQIVRSMVSPKTDVLVTTRLDSDDAIASPYLEAVQAYAVSFQRSQLGDLLVNFPQGFRLKLDERGVYASRMHNSPFHSLFERPKERPPTTVMTGKHSTTHERHATHQDESMPAWLQVLHGSNIHNKLVLIDRKLPDGMALPGFASEILNGSSR